MKMIIIRRGKKNRCYRCEILSEDEKSEINDYSGVLTAFSAYIWELEFSSIPDL